jgi:hypothetical protein
MSTHIEEPRQQDPEAQDKASLPTLPTTSAPPPVSAPPVTTSAPSSGFPMKLDSTWVFGIVGLALIGALVIALFAGFGGSRAASS